jgi:hypothetical protein
MAKTNDKTTPRSCRDCEHWTRVSERVRVSEVLQKAILKMEGEIQRDDFKTTIADYLKLVHLEQELDDDGPKEVRVTWVEPEKTEESKIDQ